MKKRTPGKVAIGIAVVSTLIAVIFILDAISTVVERPLIVTVVMIALAAVAALLAICLLLPKR